MTTKFQPMTRDETRAMVRALRMNVEEGATIVLYADTGLLGTTIPVGGGDEASDSEVINAIKSMPCHYSSEVPDDWCEIPLLRGVYRVFREGKYIGISVGRLAFGKISLIVRDPSWAIGLVVTIDS